MAGDLEEYAGNGFSSMPAIVAAIVAEAVAIVALSAYLALAEAHLPRLTPGVSAH